MSERIQDNLFFFFFKVAVYCCSVHSSPCFLPPLPAEKEVILGQSLDERRARFSVVGLGFLRLAYTFVLLQMEPQSRCSNQGGG